MVIGCPTASDSLYPKIRCAPAFQLSITPSRFLEMIASSDDSTIAACLNRACFADLCFVMSSTIATTSGDARLNKEILKRPRPMSHLVE
jgi:hypothetical protein